MVEAGLFRFSVFAPPGHVQNFLQQTFADLACALFSVEDGAGVEVDVAVHAGEGGILGDFDDRSQRAADAGTQTRGEDGHLGAA